MPILNEDSCSEENKRSEWKFIRMQNLPWTACRPDIRQFFNGLSIENGGILVRNSEAFVAFENYSDARLALYRRNILLHGCKMELSVINEEELSTILNTIVRRKLNFDLINMNKVAKPHFQSLLRRKIRPTPVFKEIKQPFFPSVFLPEETDFSPHSKTFEKSFDRPSPCCKRTVLGIRKVHPTSVSLGTKMENLEVFHPVECYNAKRMKFEI